MSKKFLTIAIVLASTLATVSVGSQEASAPGSGAPNSGSTTSDHDPAIFDGNFIRLDASTADPNGSTAESDCGDVTYDEAKASLQIVTRHGLSTVHIYMNDARPNSIYTMWLRLKGVNKQGVSFGGSPLTDGGSTPLAPSTDLPSLLAATGSGNGSTDVANALHTDSLGNGHLEAKLDFPIFNGVYPFQNFSGFDAADPRFPASANPQAVPTPIVIPDDIVDAPFGIRIVSHCTDGVGHGLTPGTRQPWFDWPQ